jgi:hypothetical protein
MMEVLDNPRSVERGNYVEFEYNGKTRKGTVERVGKTFVTIKHDYARLYGGKLYSTYKFVRLGSRIRVR